MYKKSLIAISMVLVFACNPKQNNFKEGTFEFYIEDSLSMIIERQEHYQWEYSLDNQKSEFFKIEWQGDTLYLLESMVKKDSSDFDKLYVKVDKTNNDTTYITSYMKGIDFTISSKMFKINDETSDEFKEILKRETAQ